MISEYQYEYNSKYLKVNRARISTEKKNLLVKSDIFKTILFYKLSP